jgi:hypothetical protein
VSQQRLTATQVVTFRQTSKSIPIFGTKATVEMDDTTRKLLNVEGAVTDVPDLSPIAKLTPAEGL